MLLNSNLAVLDLVADYVTTRLRFIEAWSIMQLENVGFARNRWTSLYVDHRSGWAVIGNALDKALLHGVRAHLFNFARCSVPPAYRALAPASISDWKRKYLPASGSCRERDKCCGFFDWHPEDGVAGVTPL